MGVDSQLFLALPHRSAVAKRIAEIRVEVRQAEHMALDLSTCSS